jgi:hypothetical protein
MTLRIFVAGREQLAMEYTDDDVPALARALAAHWDGLHHGGRVAVFAEHEGVAHLVAGQR